MLPAACVHTVTSVAIYLFGSLLVKGVFVYHLWLASGEWHLCVMPS